MAHLKTIEHRGVVKSIENNKITVEILATSACASCHAKGSCSAADMQEKLIEVAYLPNEKYEIGEKVKLRMLQSLGFTAVFLAYLLPFTVLFLTLIISLQITKNELFSGLIALGSTIPYYLILYLNKKKLKKKFFFKIEKQ